MVDLEDVKLAVQVKKKSLISLKIKIHFNFLFLTVTYFFCFDDFFRLTSEIKIFFHHFDLVF